MISIKFTVTVCIGFLLTAVADEVVATVNLEAISKSTAKLYAKVLIVFSDAGADRLTATCG
jgi:hypothetical protein